jgi:hypothetical protein
LIHYVLGSSHPQQPIHYPNKIMGRADKSTLISAAVAAFQKGEFTGYTKAANKFSVDRACVSKRIRGLPRLKRKLTRSTTNILS